MEVTHVLVYNHETPSVGNFETNVQVGTNVGNGYPVHRTAALCSKTIGTFEKKYDGFILKKL